LQIFTTLVATEKRAHLGAIHAESAAPAVARTRRAIEVQLIAATVDAALERRGRLLWLEPGFVDAGVLGELGVEGGGPDGARVDENGGVVYAGQDGDIRADPGDLGGADEDGGRLVARPWSTVVAKESS
jgi:hypothetical protein